jgi:hypothetical protein
MTIVKEKPMIKIDETRKPYEKPKLRVIELETDQVLAVGCKLAFGGSAIRATPCIANFCAEAGS